MKIVLQLISLLHGIQLHRNAGADLAHRSRVEALFDPDNDTTAHPQPQTSERFSAPQTLSLKSRTSSIELHQPDSSSVNDQQRNQDLAEKVHENRDSIAAVFLHIEQVLRFSGVIQNFAGGNLC